jgi:hypothetical protein
MGDRQQGRYIPPRRVPNRSARGGRGLALAVLILILVGTAAFILLHWQSRAVEYSGEQRACISHRYKQFNPQSLAQCIDACKVCMKGSTVTCNTSCKLKGAS